MSLLVSTMAKVLRIAWWFWSGRTRRELSRRWGWRLRSLPEYLDGVCNSFRGDRRISSAVILMAVVVGASRCQFDREDLRGCSNWFAGSWLITPDARDQVDIAVIIFAVLGCVRNVAEQTA